jgi:hypothetical protein
MAFRNPLLNKQAFPTVSTWGGMTFKVYYDDHVPPHFAVRVSGTDYRFAIDNLAALPSRKGQLSSTYVSQIKDWFKTPVEPGKTVKDLMYDNWLLTRNSRPIIKIPTPDQLRNRKKTPKQSSSKWHAIKKLIPVKPFSLQVEFDSGEQKLVDIQRMRGHNPMFEPLWDWDKFKKARFTPDVVEWFSGLRGLEIEAQDLWGAGE